MSIRLKLLVQHILQIIVFVALLVLYWLPTELSYEKKHDLENQQSNLEVLSFALIDPLKLGHQPHIQHILNLVMDQRGEEWLAIRLEDAAGSVLYAHSQREASLNEQDIISLQHAIGTDDKLLAKIYLTLDLKPMQASAREHMVNLTLLTVLLMVLAGVASILLQDRWLRKPIVMLARAAELLAKGDFSARLPKQKRDEMGCLVASFSMMRDYTQVYQLDLKKTLLEAEQAAVQAKADNALLAAVSDILNKYITQNNDANAVFDEVLKRVITLTESEFGFIGEICYQQDNQPYIKMFSLTDISWNEETVALYQDRLSKEMEFRNLDTLFGRVVTSGEAVISNDPSVDPRSRGTPGGHPVIRTFMGLPIRSSRGLIGIISVANRVNGYDQQRLEELSPVLQAIASLVEAYQAERARCRVEQALRENEGRLSAVIENSNDGIMTINDAGIVESVNPALLDMFGLQQHELLGENVSKLMDAAEYKKHNEALTRYSKTGKSRVLGCGSVERMAIRKDGAAFPIELAVSEMYLEGQCYFIGILRDISVRKQQEQALQQSHEQIKNILENTSDIFFAINGDFRLQYVNQRAEELFRRSRHDLIGHVLWDELPELASYFYKNCCKAIRHNQVSVFEGYYPPLNRWFEGRACPSGDGLGVFLLDITMRKLTEQNMRKATDAALQASTARSQFLANMSHEIRTPMNGVLGMLNLLRDTEMTAEQYEYVETAFDSADGLLILINDILDFSKIDAGKLTLESIDFDLRSTLESVVDMLAGQAYAKGLELIYLVPSSLADWWRGDPGRFRQILINLVGNAIKFTDQGDVVVRVTRIADNDSKSVLRFEISDTGTGIAPEVCERIFDPFSQADGSTTRRFGGTGLGLGISSQLVELMGGNIGVTSELGQGSTFWFTVEFDKCTEIPSFVEVTDNRLSGLKCLVVDDCAASQEFFKQQLTTWGMHADSIANGQLALEALRSAVVCQASYDVIISDSTMPVMDGFELAQQIKADSTIAAVKIIIVTRLGQRGEGSKAREMGIAAYISKPIRKAQLYDCMHLVMGFSTINPTPLITQHSLREIETKNTRILVVEDNAVNQRVAVGILKKLGCRADVAGNGLEAIEALGRIAYDLILMDCQMPEMDGYDATRVIRQRELESQVEKRFFLTSSSSNHVPIIAMTANAMQGDKEACLAAGMDDYLAKPVKIDLLRQKLEHWIWHPSSPNEQAVANNN